MGLSSPAANFETFSFFAEKNLEAGGGLWVEAVQNAVLGLSLQTSPAKTFFHCGGTDY